MSLSDCIMCWETPCDCGWDYRGYSIDRLKAKIRMFESIVKYKEIHKDCNFSRCMDDERTQDDLDFMKFVGNGTQNTN